MKAARDFFMTGSKTAIAEWRSLKNEGVTCGITPTDQYLIVDNGIGKTRYDEPSGSDWRISGCQATEPVRAAEAETESLKQVMLAEKRREAQVNEEVKKGMEEYIAQRVKHDQWNECKSGVLSAGGYSSAEEMYSLVDGKCGKEPPE
jgi:hypothetical protein